MFTQILIALTLMMLTQQACAFKLTFPTSYWVACKINVLQWSFDDKDPAIFSVALFNSNRSMVNGNYQIANSLQTQNGTALVQPNCVDAGDGYYLAFVNSSQYAENQPEIYYTSPTFSIRAVNTSDVPTPQGTKLSNDGQTLTGGSTTTQVNSSSTNVVPTNGTAVNNTNNAPTFGAANPGTPLRPPSSNGSTGSGNTTNGASVSAHTSPVLLINASLSLAITLVCGLFGLSLS